jgi:hypothetical protein
MSDIDALGPFSKLTLGLEAKQPQGRVSVKIVVYSAPGFAGPRRAAPLLPLCAKSIASFTA